MILHVVIDFRTIQSMLINAPVFPTKFNERRTELESCADFVAYVTKNAYNKTFRWSRRYLRSTCSLTGRFY